MRETGDMTDGELVALSVTAPRLFGELFDRHAAEILRYLTRRIGAQDAEDALSQVFLTALERRSSFDPSSPSARPWLYGIASNVLARHRRDEVRFLRALSRVPADAGVSIFDEDAAERVDAEIQAAKVTKSLTQLSVGDRNVLLLLSWAQLSHEEIAQALEIPVGTVKSRLHRARRLIRGALDESVALSGPRRSSDG